jgi:hypothetical protein
MLSCTYASSTNSSESLTTKRGRASACLCKNSCWRFTEAPSGCRAHRAAVAAFTFALPVAEDQLEFAP